MAATYKEMHSGLLTRVGGFRNQDLFNFFTNVVERAGRAND